MFLLCSDWPSRVCPMPDQPLRPATAQEVTESLAFALRYDGRKRVYTGTISWPGSPRSDWSNISPARASC